MRRPALQASQCRHLHNVLVGGAGWQVGVALGGGDGRRGDADDGCGDLAALAVQRRRLVHTHVQAGAAAGHREGQDVSSRPKNILKVGRDLERDESVTEG